MLFYLTYYLHVPQKVRVEVRVDVRVNSLTLTRTNALYIGLSALFGEWVRVE